MTRAQNAKSRQVYSAPIRIQWESRWRGLSLGNLPGWWATLLIPVVYWTSASQQRPALTEDWTAPGRFLYSLLQSKDRVKCIGKNYIFSVQNQYHLSWFKIVLPSCASSTSHRREFALINSDLFSGYHYTWGWGHAYTVWSTFSGQLWHLVVTFLSHVAL